MRTFHVGGAAEKGSQSSSVEASMDATVKIKNQNVLTNSKGETIVFSRNLEIVLEDSKGRARANYRIPYGARLLVRNKKKVKKGTKLADWDPYTKPIITDKAGAVNFVDLVEGVSMNEVMDEETNFASRIVMDWKTSPRGAELKPRITLRDERGDVIKLENGLDARYFMSVGAILQVEPGQQVGAGDVVARLPIDGGGTKDITGGLPRVAELFEARRPKDHAIIADMDGRVEYGRDYKTKRRIVIRSEDDPDIKSEFMVPKGKHLAVQEGDFISKGEYLLDGNPAPHDILEVMGVEALAEYLTEEIQDVYRLQGVKIDNKHIEVIVRQMLQKVEIVDSGETTLIAGEQVNRNDFRLENDRAAKEGLKLATAKPVLLGITKASLQTKSFISAASFQETTKVLTEASVNGKVDTLLGLKENVIVGRLIPAGTGSVVKRLRKVAKDKDMEMMEAHQAHEAESAALIADLSQSDQPADF